MRVLTCGLGRDAAGRGDDVTAMRWRRKILRPARPWPSTSKSGWRLAYLQDAWTEAAHDGIEGDCLAQTALFLALAELISTYGEEAAARYAENLGARIRNGEFSVELSRQ